MNSHLKKLTKFAMHAVDAPTLEWRHHGTGMLQAYVSPCHRLHVWHPALLLPGMRESGAWHDHRFSFTSTVLTGRIRHHRILEAEHGPHLAMWKIPGASSGSTEDLIQAGSGRFAFAPEEIMERGASYTVRRGEFHHAHQLIGDGVAVTSVLLWDKRDEPATLLAPEGTTPAHAFEGVMTPVEFAPFVAQARSHLGNLYFELCAAEGVRAGRGKGAEG